MIDEVRAQEDRERERAQEQERQRERERAQEQERQRELERAREQERQRERERVLEQERERERTREQESERARDRELEREQERNRQERQQFEEMLFGTQQSALESGQAARYQREMELMERELTFTDDLLLTPDWETIEHEVEEINYDGEQESAETYAERMNYIAKKISAVEELSVNSNPFKIEERFIINFSLDAKIAKFQLLSSGAQRQISLKQLFEL